MADIKTAVGKTVGQVTEASKQLVDSARETAGQVAERTKDAMHTVAENASNAGAYLGQQGESATSAMAGGFKATARTIRDNVPQEGPVKDAAYGVAQQFSNAAGYLDQKGFEGLIEDLSTAIVRMPGAVLAIGVGIGYLLGCSTRSRT